LEDLEALQVPRVTAQILNSSLTAGQQLNDVFNLPDDFPARSVRVLGCVIGVLFFGVDAFVWVDGRPDLGGHVREWGTALFHTLRERLGALSPDTVVLPAHYAGHAEIGQDGVVARRLGDLRRAVPELEIADEGAFVDAMQRALTTPPAAYDEIIRANLGLAPVEPDRATEWELGKNQCAAATMPARA